MFKICPTGDTCKELGVFSIAKGFFLLAVSTAMKAYGGFAIKLHTFLILMSDGGEWLVSCSGTVRNQTAILQSSSMQPSHYTDKAITC